MNKKLLFICLSLSLLDIRWTGIQKSYQNFNNSLKQLTANPCHERKITGADSVCVCTETYCDDFPPLKPPKAGHALVYESSKSGNRFRETVLELKELPNPADIPS